MKPLKKEVAEWENRKREKKEKTTKPKNKSPIRVGFIYLKRCDSEWRE